MIPIYWSIQPVSQQIKTADPLIGGYGAYGAEENMARVDYTTDSELMRD